ncbi:phosphoribosyltransferase [Sphingomonas sp. RHCKR7]|uniref:phosphoribosyltransferase n=1 Tax=Sphingomonas folli TaxID=2862497 RepID=UPI001CA596BD|nr:phosphoribosyltransferase [Sphingomonas folli]MBW6528531.1 phosphoribosyltransferase [Sphingomonas folli]
MRLPWNGGCPPVIIHRARDEVFGHWCYKLAKHHGDEKRALLLCEKLHREEALERIYDQTFGTDPRPFVVAPARPLGGTNNALGRTFARYVAQELGLGVSNAIFQTNAVRRDSIRSPFFRLSQSPTFDGEVAAGANYLLVDDVFTLGGTLACLRGFIESAGGRVVGMTALAEKGGRDVQVSLAKGTLDALNGAHDGALAALIQQRAGFALDCLTEPEGRYLLEQPSLDDIRAGFDRAADGRP